MPALRIVGREKEQFVPQNRSSSSAAELVNVERLFRLRVDFANQVGGVESFIAEIPEERAVKVVRAGLGDYANQTIGGVAQLRGIAIRVHLKLAHHFQAELVGLNAGAEGCGESGRVLRAVHQSHAE